MRTVKEIEALISEAHSPALKSELLAGLQPLTDIAFPPGLMPHRQFILDAMASLLTETERGCVLVSACLLDGLVERLLRESIVDSDEARKALSSTLKQAHSKFNVAYAFGLIGKAEYDSLKTINAIRNKYAHNLDGDDRAKWNEVAAQMKGLRAFPTAAQDTPKRRFVSAVCFLAGSLLGRLANAKHAAPVDGGPD